ncbi:hypothetical protein BGX26_002486, partial [Mortierella sp. AD094]
MVPNVVRKDEGCAQRFNKLAIKVDGAIHGLKRGASFMEISVKSDRAHRASIEMELGNAERLE